MSVGAAIYAILNHNKKAAIVYGVIAVLSIFNMAEAYNCYYEVWLIGEKGVAAFSTANFSTAKGMSESGSGSRDNRLALGVNEYLDDFANTTNAHTWKEFPDPNNWQQGVLDAIYNPDMEIVFNLDGIDNPWSAVTRAANGTGRATEWELLQIKLTPESWGRITWYKNGEIVSNPFE